MVYTGCDKCKYDSKRTDEYPCNECVPGASVKEHFKPMTNADRIRNADDNELAEFLVNLQKNAIESGKADSVEEALEFLQSEVEEGGEDE